MTTATFPATWPAEARFEPIDQALTAAYNELEEFVRELRAAIDGPDESKVFWPRPLPTFETVGMLWSQLDGLRMDIHQLTEEADTIEGLIDEVNTIRRDGALQDFEGGERG
jgi:hypothetical protein